MLNGQEIKFDISKIKKVVSAPAKINQKVPDNTAERAFNTAINYLEAFHNQPGYNPEPLKKAAEKLLESLKINNKNPEALILLSFIFYMLGDDKLAHKYTKLANNKKKM